jgi:hypothetical protein
MREQHNALDILKIFSFKGILLDEAIYLTYKLSPWCRKDCVAIWGLQPPSFYKPIPPCYRSQVALSHARR